MGSFLPMFLPMAKLDADGFVFSDWAAGVTETA
jgi:hypothetical protein